MWNKQADLFFPLIPFIADIPNILFLLKNEVVAVFLFNLIDKQRTDSTCVIPSLSLGWQNSSRIITKSN